MRGRFRSAVQPPIQARRPPPAPDPAVRVEPPHPSQPKAPLPPSEPALAANPPARSNLQPCQAGKAFLSLAIFSSVATPRTPVLEDVQARRPTTHLSLTRVGVTNVEKVVRI